MRGRCNDDLVAEVLIEVGYCRWSRKGNEEYGEEVRGKVSDEFWEEKRRGKSTEASIYIDLHPIVMLDNTLG